MTIRRCFIVLLCLLLLCRAGYPTAIAEGQEAPLVVYYAGENRLYREALAAYQRSFPEKALDVTVFASDEEMEARLSIELLSGAGPDVILLGLGSGLDFQKLARGGLFCDLTDRFAQDESFSPDQYFAPMLEAGKLDGGTYAAAFSFSLPHLITSQEKLDAMGASDPEDMTFREILALLTARAQAIAGEDTALMSVMTRRTDVAYYLYEASVGSLYDPSGEMLPINEEALREICDLLRAFFEGMPQLQAITRRYRNDFVSAVSKIDFLIEDYQLPVNMRYYDTYYGAGLGQTLRVIPIPAFDQAGTYRAQVTEYGVVAAHCRQVENAYQLLRYIQDYQTDGVFSRIAVQDALEIPVRKAAAEVALKAAMTSGGGNAMLSGKWRAIPALPSAFGEQIMGWYERIDSAYIPNHKIGNIVAETMEGYYTGVSDDDSCYGLLSNALWIYMSE